MLFPNFEKNTKKNKIVKFPTKMKRKIDALKGRLLYGAPKGALIFPFTVVFAVAEGPLSCLQCTEDEKIAFFREKSRKVAIFRQNRVPFASALEISVQRN